MISCMGKVAEQVFLQNMEKVVGVTDAYFHKGRLFVVNDYDLDAVKDFLDLVAVDVDYQLISEEAITY